ncbi:MAG: LysR family transcriptional regulator [Lachnospiraceae bacterium]|nr:LysR family transcriptional regulator [Lachnospiraceae bacterium]
MTAQQLRYVIAVAETGSITEAARRLFIAQPSLSSAIRELETEIGIQIFVRNRAGISITAEGMEFLGYARQVVEPMQALTDRYISGRPERQRFCVSTQHYTFTANAFVKMVQRYGQERYEFIFNETQTNQILQDVRNRFCDVGILYLSRENKTVLQKSFADLDLRFTPIFTAKPHVFLHREHPLTAFTKVKLIDLEPYPRLSFLQGAYESPFFSEELFSTVSSEKSIKVSDRAAIVNLMIGLQGYTISSGIFPRHLQGEEIIALPLDEPEYMEIGYLLNRDQTLSELGAIYIDALREYAENT